MPRVLIFAIIVSVFITVVVCRQGLKAKFGLLLDWVQQHPTAGSFLISACTVLTVVLMLPYTLFAVGAGYALSRTFSSQLVTMLVGTITVFTGALLGALLAFVCGRYILRNQVQNAAQKSKILRAIDVTIED